MLSLPLWPQGATEGEEADAEESDSDNKHPSDTSCDECGNKEGGEEEEEEEAAVESKTEEEEEDVKREDSALFHQFTRTSVESQPGSLEGVDVNPPQNLVHAIEVPKVGAGGGGGGSGQRRSRSPARIKRHKPKESDGAEMDDF